MSVDDLLNLLNELGARLHFNGLWFASKYFIV